MADDSETIIVIDVEATCWEKKPPPGQHSEIIEIGLTLLDLAQRQLVAKHSILVRPHHSTVSAFCTELTTLTQEQVEKGLPFEVACALLESDYRSRERLWVSWGDYDRKMFESQCAHDGVPYPFGDRHVNVKQLYAHLRQGKPVGVRRALKQIGLPFEGTYHRGVDDAWNIGHIILDMLERYGEDILVAA